MKILIYSASNKKGEEILESVKQRFDLEIKANNLIFVKNPAAELLRNPKNFPTFTLFWQAIQ